MAVGLTDSMFRTEGDLKKNDAKVCLSIIAITFSKQLMHLLCTSPLSDFKAPERKLCRLGPNNHCNKP